MATRVMGGQVTFTGTVTVIACCPGGRSCTAVTTTSKSPALSPFTESGQIWRPPRAPPARRTGFATTRPWASYAVTLSGTTWPATTVSWADEATRRVTVVV